VSPQTVKLLIQLGYDIKGVAEAGKISLLRTFKFSVSIKLFVGD
jgi:hypothetical protein